MEVLKITSPHSSGDQPMTGEIETLRDRLGSAMRIADQLVGTSPVASPEQVDERYIRSLLRLRRNRSRFFSDTLFADPAWDMLLELYGAALGQYRITVSNLCNAGAVPATTALRWIGQLQDQGLIDRRPDPTDGRRQFVMLSVKALASMNAYFRTVPAGGLLI